MKLKMLAAAAALLVTGLASASTTLNAGAYSVNYDETTPGFGFISSWGSGPGNLVSFEWSLQAPVQVTSFGGTITATYAMPDFTLAANVGWALSGAFTASIGNVTYFEAGTASTDLAAGGSVTIDANPTVVVPLTSLTKVSSGPNTGWFAGSVSVPVAGFNSLSVSGGSLVLTATAGASSFAAVVGQPQNKLKFEFFATELPVPEPETYALLLAGLGVMGLIARRRQPR